MKNPKLIMVVMMMFVFLSLVSPASFVYEENSSVNQRIRCFDTSNDYCNNETFCYASVQDPTGDTAVNNVSMTFNETFYNITMPTNRTGTYSVIGACSSATNMTFEFSYLVTQSGAELSGSEATLHVTTLVILLLLVTVGVWGAIVLPFKNSRDGDGFVLGINYFKYLKVFMWFFSYFLFVWILNILVGLSNNYLSLNFVFPVFSFLFRFLSVMMYPSFIILFVIMIALYFKDKQVQKWIERGIKVS